MKALISRIRRSISALFPIPMEKEDFDVSRPFTSQNTWEKLVGFYQQTQQSPRILEYGSGISTYYHLENLLRQGGELVSIEHDKEWYDKIWNSFVHIYKSRLNTFSTSSNGSVRVMQGVFPATNKVVRFAYHFQPSQSRTGCGTLEEFEDYVHAPQGVFDVIVVDGRARKACVNYVLEGGLLKSGGLLVLFEAGRGNSVWPKKSQMLGTYDYQPEVNKLLALGAVVLDGAGYDVWTNWTPDRASKEGMATSVPMEACFYKKELKTN